MNLLEKLDLLMLEKGINKPELAKGSKVPYTTIASLYDKGYENVRLTTLKRLSSYFRCSLDYLADDTIEDRYLGITLDYVNGKTKHKKGMILEGDNLPSELQGLDIKLEVIREVVDSGLNEKQIKHALRLYKLYAEDDSDDQ